MLLTEVSNSKDFQAVKLPKNFRVEGDQIFIKKVGKCFLLIPEKNTMMGMIEGINEFTDDFMEDGRAEFIFTEREEF